MADVDHEQRVRAACFVQIGQMQRVHGDVLPVDVIRRGVVIDGERIALVNPYKGIHKPRQLDAALAVTTTPPTSTKDAPYDDRMGDDGLYVYHYRTAGSDSRRAHQQAERDNASVRFAKDMGLEPRADALSHGDQANAIMAGHTRASLRAVAIPAAGGGEVTRRPTTHRRSRIGAEAGAHLIGRDRRWAPPSPRSPTSPAIDRCRRHEVLGQRTRQGRGQCHSPGQPQPMVILRPRGSGASPPPSDRRCSTEPHIGRPLRHRPAASIRRADARLGQQSVDWSKGCRSWVNTRSA